MKNKSYYLNLIIILILLLILLYTIHYFVKYSSAKKIKELFINNPNYCQSLSGDFIYITDPNDKRCIKNNELIDNTSFNSGKGNCLKNDTWGIFHKDICYTFQNFFSKFYNINYNDYLSLSNKNNIDDSTNLLNLNNISSEEEILEKKKEKKRTCDELKLPNSGRCLELFDNESPNQCSIENLERIQNSLGDNTLDDLCSDKPNYGFYKMQCFTERPDNPAPSCRKYYKSNNNNLLSDNKEVLGTYQPNNYNSMYVPLKSDRTINQTGCFEKSMDFNNICARVNNNQLYGAYKILNGEDGNCYQENGLEDKTKSNALCSQNFYNERPTVYVKNGYSTKCLPLFSNYTNECRNLITNYTEQSFPYEIKAEDINSYDCPPNKARAKCIFYPKPPSA